MNSDDKHYVAHAVNAYPALIAELNNIVNAKRVDFQDAEEFRLWAKSRCGHLLRELGEA